MKKNKSSFNFSFNNDDSTYSPDLNNNDLLYEDVVIEEVYKSNYSSTVKTLKDFSEEEILALEKKYNAKIKRDNS